MSLQARKNARGIAASGSAQSLFRTALSGDSRHFETEGDKKKQKNVLSPEVTGMGAKEREKQAQKLNFGVASNDNQPNDRRENSTQRSNPVPVIKHRPSDGGDAPVATTPKSSPTNPGDIVRAGFAKDDFASSSRNSDKVKNGQKSVGNARFSEPRGSENNSEVQNRSIPALQNANDNQRAEQEASLNRDRKPGPELADEARAFLDKESQELFDDPTKIRNMTKDQLQLSNDIDVKNSDELKDPEPIQDILTPEQISSINPESSNRNKYLSAMKKLSEAGFKNISAGDIDTILKAGREVPLPMAYIIISIFNFFTSIVFSLIGITMTVVGLGADAVGWASAIFTFGIGALAGSIVGKSVAVVGIGIWVMQIATNTILSIGSIISQIYYLKSASIILRKTGILKKYALRLLTIRGITILLGWVPLLNGFIFLAGGRSFYRMAKREIHKAIDIVEKEFR